jgi:integrase
MVSVTPEPAFLARSPRSNRGFEIPREKNPVRVVLKEQEYRGLLEAAVNKMDWRFRVALILAHETGHGIGVIRMLWWSDINLEDGLIRWRAEGEKTGYEHLTPMTPLVGER